MSKSLQKPQVRVALAFLLLGFSPATWAARIPAVKADLHLSSGELGIALLGPAVGAVLAMPTAGALLATFAPRRIVQTGYVLIALLFPLITVADCTWQLFLVLAGWGAGLGLVDVAINTEAARVQDQLGRQMMSRLHAAYSVGGLVGAGLGAIAAATGLSPEIDFVVAAFIVLFGGVTVAENFVTKSAHTESHHRHHRRRPQWSWTLIALAAMAFGSFLAEGAANDWSAVYLHSTLHAPAGLAALTYSLFAATMTAGRLVGDALSDRIGPVRLIRIAAGTAGFGFAAALIVGHVWAGLAGFAILGGGLSFTVPLVFTATGRFTRTGPNMAFVTTCGYVGMLVGPGLIGGLAQTFNLAAALGVIVFFCFLAALLAGVTGERATSSQQDNGASLFIAEAGTK